MKDINTLLSNHDELRNVTMKLGQILQVATLRLKGSKQQTEGNPNNTNENNRPEQVVIANTHLFYHPMADHIRAMQAYAVCKKVDEIRRRRTSRSTATETCPVPFILCGDLNSDPLSGAAQLLLDRSVLPCHRDCWKYLHTYKWDMEEDDAVDDERRGRIDTDQSVVVDEEGASSLRGTAIGSKPSLSTGTCPAPAPTPTPPSIHLPSSFPNLISGCREMPKFTNYALGFVETLDYILASEPSKTESYGFIQLNSAPMPSEDMVRRYIAMPNEFMPSDHVSIVCDLEWRKYL